jgi:hypothetical protein
MRRFVAIAAQQNLRNAILRAQDLLALCDDAYT